MDKYRWVFKYEVSIILMKEIKTSVGKVKIIFNLYQQRHKLVATNSIALYIIDMSTAILTITIPVTGSLRRYRILAP